MPEKNPTTEETIMLEKQYRTLTKRTVDRLSVRDRDAVF